MQEYGKRAKAGTRALSDWLRRCRASVGEVRGETFRRLLKMLVGLVLLYGVEMWGCGRQLGPVENVQMRAVRIFMGVGQLHPLASLQFEMNVLPVKWESMKRGIKFWVHVMRLGEGRLLIEGGHEGSYEVGKQSEMGERSEDGFGRFWVARSGHAGIE